MGPKLIRPYDVLLDRTLALLWGLFTKWQNELFGVSDNIAINSEAVKLTWVYKEYIYSRLTQLSTDIMTIANCQ